MSITTRIETATATAILRAQGSGARHHEAPGRLAQALHYAVTPGGARIRPTILLSVAMACGDDRPALSDAAAVALELIHCASLVHDDLPCFDDADTRRGKPTLHRAYSEPLAVLTGDSLIVLAFDVLAAQGGFPPEMLDVVLHHHELLDGSGYPNALRGNQISDIVRLTTIVDIYAALVEKRAYLQPYFVARVHAALGELAEFRRKHQRVGAVAPPAS